MTQKFKILQKLVKCNISAINLELPVHSSLKDILIKLYKLHYVRTNVSSIDIRTKKGKELILQEGIAFNQSTLISRHGLFKKNWNNELIKKYLKYPDISLKDERIRIGKEAHLFSLCRVEYMETLPEIQEQLKINQELRTEASNYTSINVVIDSIDFNIEIVPIGILINKAVDYFNELKIIGTEPIDKSSAPDKLERVCMNYLRHNCSSYEEQFNLIFDVADYTVACSLLKKRVNNEIKKLYPNLKSSIYKYKSGLIH